MSALAINFKCAKFKLSELFNGHFQSIQTLRRFVSVLQLSTKLQNESYMSEHEYAIEM